MKSLTLSITCCVLVALILSGCSSSSATRRDREVQRYWRQEVRLGKSKDHQRIARDYPEIGWLSGLWCLEGERDPSIHYEILDAREVRVATKGYTAAETKKILIHGTRYFDLWYYSPGDSYRFVALTRVEKRGNDQYARVYGMSERIREADPDVEAIFEKFSASNTPARHWDNPKVYRQCN